MRPFDDGVHRAAGPGRACPGAPRDAVDGPAAARAARRLCRAGAAAGRDVLPRLRLSRGVLCHRPRSSARVDRPGLHRGPAVRCRERPGGGHRQRPLDHALGAPAPVARRRRAAGDAVGLDALRPAGGDRSSRVRALAVPADARLDDHADALLRLGGRADRGLRRARPDLGLARDGGPCRHDPRRGALFPRRQLHRGYAQRRRADRRRDAACLPLVPRPGARTAGLQSRQRQPALARPGSRRRAAVRPADPRLLRQQRGECAAGGTVPVLRRPAPRSARVGRAAADRLLRGGGAGGAAVAVARPAPLEAPGLVLGDALRLRRVRRRASCCARATSWRLRSSAC